MSTIKLITIQPNHFTTYRPKSEEKLVFRHHTSLVTFVQIQSKHLRAQGRKRREQMKRQGGERRRDNWGFRGDNSATSRLSFELAQKSYSILHQKKQTVK